MATIVLSSVGAAIGGSLFGPVGAVLGRAAGGYAGSLIDQRIFTKDQVIKGPRLEDAQIMASSDGAPMPKVYGRARLGGQLVWATRFEQSRRKRSQGGGKGAPAVSVETARYLGNFAIAICEGPISMVSRIWADGTEIDRTRLEIRIYNGSEDQEPDPLIEAKQGAGRTPAFRGTAYAVFESFPLERYGNRIPQFSFEVLRSVARLDREVRAITIIPGATEFGLSPTPVEAAGNSGSRFINRNTTTHVTDWAASLDDLQALCPNLESVALVVSWFGDDLRAGNCRIEPRVENAASGASWRVSGITRGNARETSRIDGRPAYGGTPSDATVIDAIADLKARGLKVMLYPFVMMDIAPGNALPDPYGAAAQGTYPWRGMVTCHPAPGETGTADKTALARTQVNAFTGSVQPGAFSRANDRVDCSSAELSYRRMVLHYANLAVLAGGVDGFLVGSEMRGLTTVRDETGAYPFVEALAALAGDVRAITGPAMRITYAADWSEYFGHQPQDGSGDLRYHLDPLWAHPAIDAVGIDNYMPLADWRLGGDPADEFAASQFDSNYLGGNIAGGEGFDWYYATPADRTAGSRTPITDGLGEPWVWRYKDIVSWWSNPHHERIAGVRSAMPTAWVPKSKPVWFTELGCAAVTMGANQPNVFADPKSSQAALPYFSTGARCDLAQNRFLAAHFDHWSDPAANPLSPVYGGRMVDPDRIYLWAWDARPFPCFPAQTGVWSDGGNWHTGHWLNGRIGGCPLDDLLAAIADDFGLEASATCDGFLDGYVVTGPMPARGALEPLVEFFGLCADDETGTLRFTAKAYAARAEIDPSDLVEAQEAPRVRLDRDQETELPQEAGLNHADIFAGYEAGHSYSRRLETASRRTVSMQLPAVMPRSTAIGVLEARLREAWIGRERLTLGLPVRHARLSAGDVVSFAPDIEGEWRIESIEDGEDRRLSLRASARFPELPAPVLLPTTSRAGDLGNGKPVFIAMNLPVPASAATPRILCALDAKPWAGQYAIYASPGLSGFSLRKSTTFQAITGTLLAPLTAGPEGRWDMAGRLHVELRNGQLASDVDALILNGANAAAVRSQNGEWEILQFASARLQSDGSWLLSRLLRAQYGTDAANLAGCAAGADFVLLDDAVEAVEIAPLEAGLTLNWRAGPAIDPVSAASYADVAHAHQALDQRPLSPVHLVARRLANGDVQLGWKRRARVGADTWDAADVPLDEPSERYRVEILSTSGAVVRIFEIAAPQAVYTAAQRAGDPGQLPSQVRFTVAQIAGSGMAGTARSAAIDF